MISCNQSLFKAKGMWISCTAGGGGMLGGAGGDDGGGGGGKGGGIEYCI